MKDNLIDLENVTHVDSGIVPGTIQLPNASRFDSAYMSEPLTAYALGYRDTANLDEMINFLAAKVQVPSKFEYRTGKENEAFFTELDDERAIGAEFKKVEYSTGLALGKTVNRGLTFRADLDQWKDIPNWREQITGMLVQRLKRNRLRRIIALLNASSTNVAKTWCTGGKASDPHMDLESQLDLAGDETGINPNTALFTSQANTLRKKAYRSQLTSGSNAAAGLTLNELADELGVERGIKVSRERFAVKKTGNKSKIASGNQVFLSYVQDGANTEDASNIKLFWTPTKVGGEIAVYKQPVGSGEKFEDITVELYEALVATHTSGLRKLTLTEDASAPA